MDLSFVYGIVLLVGLLFSLKVYQDTAIQKTKIENEALIQKAEIYKDRHVQQARIEAQGWMYGFNDSDQSVSTSSDNQNDLTQLLSLVNSPEGQALINQFVKK
jgi:hypothetical protein